MTGCTRGTQYQTFMMQHKPKFRTNQKVLLKDRPQPYRVAAMHRLEIWFIYELVETPGFFVKEELLKPYQEELSEISG